MAIDQVGLEAVQSLGIDVGNLSGRLAIVTAMVNHIVRLADDVDQSTWERKFTEGDDTGIRPAYFVVLQADQVEKVEALLSAIDQLR